MFDTVVKYFSDYWKQRAKSFANEEKRKWFAYESDSMEDLIDKKFDSSAESDELETISKGDGKEDFAKLQAIRIKIAIIAGLRHDIRAQFAVGENNADRNDIDLMRHAASRCAFLSQKFSEAATYINGKASAKTP